MAFFEGCPVGWGGGTHRSWPGGRGVDQGSWLQERVGGWCGGWMAVPNKGGVGVWLAVPKRGKPGKGWLGSSKGFRKITHLPFQNRSPWIPPRALKQANPSLDLPLFGTANQAPTPPSTRPAPVGTPPHPTTHPSKRNFSSFCACSKQQKYDTRCEICSVPGARAPTTYPPPEPKPLAPPSPCPAKRLLLSSGAPDTAPLRKDCEKAKTP